MIAGAAATGWTSRGTPRDEREASYLPFAITWIVVWGHFLLVCMCSAWLLGTDRAAPTWVLVIGGLAIALGLAGRGADLVALLILASASQRIWAALSGSPTVLYVDDVVLLGVVPFVLQGISAAMKPVHRRYLVALSAVLLLSLARSPNLTIGSYQLRQVGIPILLVLLGARLTRVDISKIASLLVSVAVAGSLYVVTETLGWRLVDPSAAVGLSDFQTVNLRLGLPASYLYFTNDAGDFLTRAGGHLLNPPAEGLFLASAMLWIVFTRPSRTAGAQTVLLTLVGAAALMPLARGGVLILVLLAIQPLVTRWLGRYSFLVAAAVGGFVALNELSSVGNSAKHSDGLLTGVLNALTHPLGSGFGLVGNAVRKLSESYDTAGESLAAVFLTATGWTGIVVLLWMLWIGAKHGRSVSGVVITGAILNFMLSETSGGLDASGALWILVGYALLQTGELRPPSSPKNSNQPERCDHA